MDRDLLALADRLWRGEASTEEHHPLLATPAAVEPAPGVLFVRAFGNVSAIATDDGLVLVDAGGPFTTDDVHRLVREWSDAPVRDVVLTHGHIDHVLGMPPFEREAERKGWDAPRVVAHAGVPSRFARYRRTRGFNAAINAKQFGVEGLGWPVDYPEPGATYADRLDLEVGGARLELRHARGETDDATWVWLPSRGLLCTGDLFIWAVPNAGNPQKAQRYPDEWAAALREMASLEPEVLLPGHGWPVIGSSRVAEALGTTAELLETLVERTLELMNAGAPLDEILQRVEAPAALLAKPWLRPVYDDPEFVVRSIWRLYGGWWDADPASLKPAPADALAAEVARLSGGAEALARRALELAGAGDVRLAGHLADWAARAGPDDASCLAARGDVYARRAAEEPSLMARNIFRGVADAAGPGAEDPA